MPSKPITIHGVATWEDSAPPGIWQPVFPTNPIAPGGPPPGIWPSPGHPAHPIAPGGPPPGMWIPAFPTNPIAPGGPPPEIWKPVFPTHPIVLPPPPEEGVDDSWSWAYSPVYGWVVVPPAEGGKPQPPAK